MRFCRPYIPRSRLRRRPGADGDLIDRLETLLDKLEPRFWTALGMAPDSSGYREAREMVLEVGSTGRRIQQLVTRSGNRELPNITGELVSLQNLFTQTRRSQAQSYRYRFELTGMAQYEREFRRLASQRGDEAAPECEADAGERLHTTTTPTG